MDGRGGSGWLRALAFLVTVLVIGGIGYILGAGTGGVVTTAAPAGTVVYAPWHGFGFFGFLFPLLFIFLLFFAFSGGRGRGGYGRGSGPSGWYGPGEHRDVPPPYDAMLETWHKRAHGEPDNDPRPEQRSGPTA